MLKRLRSVINVLPFNTIVASAGARALFGRYSTNALCRMFEQAMSKVTPAVFRARLRSVLEVDVTNDLARLELPTRTWPVSALGPP